VSAAVEEIRDRAAPEKAHARMQEFMQSDDDSSIVIRDVCRFPLNGLGRGLRDAAQ